MKKVFYSVACGLCAMLMTSCATINSGAAISSNSTIGSMMGEATSTIYLGTWSSNGQKNNIEEAAKNGGIKKVSHVEYVDQSIFLGLIIKHTTRVFGE